LILEKIKLRFYNTGFSRKEMFILLWVFLVLLTGSGIKVVKLLFPGTRNFDYFESERKALSFKVLSDSIANISNEQDSTVINNLILLSNTKQKKSALLINKKININSADKNELMKLPGVGPKMADMIIEYRNENSGFKTIHDLMKVKGIGGKKFLNVKNYISIN
jgi:comEA protein